MCLEAAQGDSGGGDKQSISVDHTCRTGEYVVAVASALLGHPIDGARLINIWHFLFLSHPASCTYLNYRITTSTNWLKKRMSFHHLCLSLYEIIIVNLFLRESTRRTSELSIVRTDRFKTAANVRNETWRRWVDTENKFEMKAFRRKKNIVKEK